MLQVHTDARPCLIPAAHRIDEYIRRRQIGRGVGMPRPPPLEAGQGVLFSLSAPDLDEWILCRAAARRLRARRFAGPLSVVGRSWRIAEAFVLMTRRQFEQGREGAPVRIYRGMPVAHLREAPGHRDQGKVARVVGVDLVPCQRR